MALLDREQLTSALTRLGELATSEGYAIDLLIVGGGVMVLEFGTRPSTRDLDAVAIGGADVAVVRRYAATVAAERGWPADWLNDAAKGFVVGPVSPTAIVSVPGIRVLRPAVAQLLAMKLCAWRDDVDIADAARLLAELPADRQQAWMLVEPHLQPGRELSATYAFEDLWENRP